MMYKLISHEWLVSEEHGLKLKMVIEKKTFFGLFKSIIEVIESNNIYVDFYQRVWYYFPSFKVVSAYDKLQGFCNRTKTKILFEEEYLKILAD